MGATIVVVHPRVPALAQLAADLRATGLDVREREVAVGAAAFVLRTRPAVAIVSTVSPLVSGVEVIRSVVGAAAAPPTRLLLHGAAESSSSDLEALSVEAGAHGWLRGEGPELVEAVRSWLPPAPARDRANDSGTRLRDLKRYVLVACAPRTRQRLLDFAPGVHRHITDSGTEALRLICSPSPPELALIGSSLPDLECLTVLQTAVRVDPSWRSRVVLIAEHSVAPVSLDVLRADANVWSDVEPLQGLDAILYRVRRGA